MGLCCLIMLLFMNQLRINRAFIFGKYRPRTALFSTAAVEERKKRKVALVCSYVGTKYHGLQINLNTAGVNTIESELMGAMLKSRTVKESNSVDFGKIGWSRSSRTDKGVHAARIILSGKFEVDLNWYSEENPAMDPLVKALNEHLPEDIRVLSACRINNGFMARDACHWRQYEYIMPEEALYMNTTYNEKDIDELVKKLNENLQQMIGPHSFHNFHRLRGKEVVPHSRKGQQQGDAYDKRSKHNATSSIISDNEEESEQVGGVKDDETESDDITTDDDINKTQSNSTDNNNSSSIIDNSNANDASTTNNKPRNYLADWTPVPRITGPKLRGVVYRFDAVRIKTVDGKAMIKITIRGQSFLLNQIRLMVSAALLVTRGQLPPHTIQMALKTLYFINMPMVPPNGLLLYDTGIGKNANGEVYSLSPSSCDYNRNNSLLLSKEQENTCQEFLQNKIYPQVSLDWYANNQELLKAYLDLCSCYQVSDEISQQWKQLIEESEISIEASRRIRVERLLATVMRNIQQFKEVMDKKFANGNYYLYREMNPKMLPNNLITSYSNFIRGSLTSELAIKYDLAPCETIYNILRYVATRIAHFGHTSLLELEPKQLVEVLDKEVEAFYYSNTNNDANASSGGHGIRISSTNSYSDGKNNSSNNGNYNNIHNNNNSSKLDSSSIKVTSTNNYIQNGKLKSYKDLTIEERRSVLYDWSLRQPKHPCIKCYVI